MQIVIVHNHQFLTSSASLKGISVALVPTRALRYDQRNPRVVHDMSNQTREEKSQREPPPATPQTEPKGFWRGLIAEDKGWQLPAWLLGVPCVASRGSTAPMLGLSLLQGWRWHLTVQSPQHHSWGCSPKRDALSSQHIPPN